MDGAAVMVLTMEGSHVGTPRVGRWPTVGSVEGFVIITTDGLPEFDSISDG